ncbi:hypothetical protein Kpol_1027p5 [Vanderwaltozyma polyspora DSM 70294]|uniref:Peptidase M20 dimerisation domain-containing protein n=1 Tax=Vanderwaltozyma polyspora (strain ATCC 22028 / DSM 70294 / BCRC 21397 / CBS 2163 / NBRC 10782 / NRRL Y-8283 / UCD 57-17) TaxID=436907 RepID=A7TQL0_VANPO|nr:uncharacterized protein Kpol_1027p5 [Vanderwaltozyma polyspora DSM 70294]EDO15431.1 hypothetical protein Kpol_1027p5 [Vanderwaltozyma polyspora DSM 70294]
MINYNNSKKRGRDNSNVLLYPELIHRWNHSYSILSIVPFPSKNLLFAGTQDSKILVFDMPNYNLIKTIRLGSLNDVNTRSSVLCMTRSDDEKYLFSAGADSLVRIWSVGEMNGDSYIQINENATIYTITDIGDIFSIRYLDSLDTLFIGCQNASMLFLDNLQERIKSEDFNSDTDFERLPHRRYDKFFDSNGPGGNLKSKEKIDSPLFSTSSPENLINNCILEIPSENIISYAHNGFIYSIYRLQHTFLENNDKSIVAKEFIITGGGDGLSKLWKVTKDSIGQISVDLDPEFFDNDDSVLSQTFEFPFLYCGLSDGVLKIWDLNTRQLVSTLRTPDPYDIISLSIYHNHVFAINESGITHFYDNKFHNWDPNQGKILSSEVFERKCNVCNKPVSLLTGGNDGSLTLWNLSHLMNIGDSTENKYTEHQCIRERSNSITYYKPAVLDNDSMLDTVRELIAFQTVSQNPDTTQQMDSRRCANHLQQLFVEFGASKTQIFPASTGNPVVFAQFNGDPDNNNKKRILWYGHYDVIPSGNTNLWNTDPFRLTCENGYMKGRGVSDNKGPLVAAIYAVASLFQQNSLVNDVVFLIEGNEEIGSLGLEDICVKYKDLIGPKVDWIFLSNSTWVDKDHPCLNYGLRGVINAEIQIFSDEPDSHSGLAGGIHMEPVSDLVSIISKLQNEDDYIKIPNFYESIVPLSSDDKERIQKVIEVTTMNRNLTLEDLIANWTMPSLSITSMKTSGPGNITVIPKLASIGVSIRLVPEQSVEKIKTDFINYIEQCFNELKTKNHLKINIVNEASGWLGDPNSTAYRLLKEEVAIAWDMEPLLVREGGSIPCVRTLEMIFDAPAVQIPCGQSTDNAHLDNENLRIRNLSQMASILNKVFNRL